MRHNEIEYEFCEDDTQDGAEDDDDQAKSEYEGEYGYDNENKDEITDQPKNGVEPVYEVDSVSANAPCQIVQRLGNSSVHNKTTIDVADYVDEIAVGGTCWGYFQFKGRTTLQTIRVGNEAKF